MPLKFQNKLILGDGTVLEESNCGYTDKSLWCWITGKTMMECVEMFSDPEKTAEIISFYLNRGYMYKGFTELLLVQKSETGIDVRLTWPEGGEHSMEDLPDSSSENENGETEELADSEEPTAEDSETENSEITEEPDENAPET